MTSWRQISMATDRQRFVAIAGLVRTMQSSPVAAIYRRDRRSQWPDP
jgi:hypothetical protein